MADFQYKFFPTVYNVEVRHVGGVIASNPVQAAYCKYNNQLLQLVVSSLYISALFSGIVASRFARALGRKVSLRPSLHSWFTLWLLLWPECSQTDALVIVPASLWH